ncbi:hypothetical protein GJ699_20070 [Duganella sp. FT80W]|uniref:Sulfotransferase family protein n=1 Tax=Duganella guangzhouensis TaxID=2666084 RepID=A0A6I2L6J9_9BURK|nr:sulfotransferase [Duganella guangzhouensis]MRW92296.1 hypothetical protein [Duganella guangzhouensis]
MDNTTLVITGMHRSGTSLVTNWLHNCGLQVGESLLDAGKGNVEGHFEDLEFLKIHEEILADKGADPSGLFAPFDLIPSRYETAKMKAIISVKNARYQQWGWKEPRTCLFLSTYTELLPQARYLVLQRDYREVVQSLLKRDFSYIDDKYQARSWPVRLVWNHFYRSIRFRKHRAKYYDRYLTAWIVYNRMILKALHTLPEDRYLVVSYKSLKSQCADVFNFLTDAWSFRLTYKKFTDIYRSELINTNTDHLPETADDHLLAEAQQISGQMRAYLQKSSERLAHQAGTLSASSAA